MRRSYVEAGFTWTRASLHNIFAPYWPWYLSASILLISFASSIDTAVPMQSANYMIVWCSLLLPYIYHTHPNSHLLSDVRLHCPSHAFLPASQLSPSPATLTVDLLLRTCSTKIRPRLLAKLKLPPETDYGKNACHQTTIHSILRLEEALRNKHMHDRNACSLPINPWPLQNYITCAAKCYILRILRPTAVLLLRTNLSALRTPAALWLWRRCNSTTSWYLPDTDRRPAYQRTPQRTDRRTAKPVVHVAGPRPLHGNQDPQLVLQMQVGRPPSFHHFMEQITAEIPPCPKPLPRHAQR